MAWILSTGAKNALLQTAATAQLAQYSASIAFEDGTGGGGNDRIVDAVVDLSGFDAYEYFTLSVVGSTLNDGDYIIQNAAAGYIELPAASLATEALGDDVTLIVSQGGSFAEVFRNSVMDLYSGTRPTTADLAETGTQLVRLTKDGNAFVSGAHGNGINMGLAASGVLSLATDPATGAEVVVTGDGLVTGDAYMAVLYGNTVVTGASSVAVKMYGRVATSGAEVNMSAGIRVTATVAVTPTSFSFSI